MRRIVLALPFLLLACTGAPSGGVNTTLTPADAATSLMARGPIVMTVTSPGQSPEGEDPLVLMTLRARDGRTMSFEEGNHAPVQVMAQSRGGPLAQIMGLPDAAAPTLYGLRPDGAQGTPFICPPGGPISIGYYAAPNGDVTIVGLKQNIEFETLPDGTMSPLPFSPDLVCGRLHFRKS